MRAFLSCVHPNLAVWVVVVGCVLGGVGLGCEGQSHGPPEETLVVQRGQGLEAYCSIVVQTVGLRDMETDYLPQVVACENGGADFEALKAQAVAARAYAYYRLDTGDGTIAPDTSDQAYLCSREPGPEHYEAVAQTAGQVLRYNSKLVAAFYVAGSVPSDRQSCIAQPGDNDYSNTERYVTYNQGRGGGDLEQTTLGWVNPRNDRNRGCKSQNGAHCLAEAGWDYRDILTFYYGSDIELVQAEGACVGPVEPVSCGDPVLAQGSVLDEDSTCFQRSCQTGDWWWDHPQGHEDDSITTYTIDNQPDCVGSWTLEFEADGDYLLQVHLTDVVPLSTQAQYRVRHADGEDVVVVNQRGVNGWAELGTFRFTSDTSHSVQLTDSTGEPYVGQSGPRIMFDALRVLPADAVIPEEDTGVPEEDTGVPSEDTDLPEEDAVSQPDSSPDVDTGHGGSEEDTGGGGTSEMTDTGADAMPENGADAGTDAFVGAETRDNVVSFQEGGCTTVSSTSAGRGVGLWLGLIGVVIWARRRR
ncbi:MAG: SpoIID/LytB domain-containing protein [Myxococcota bacterium]